MPLCTYHLDQWYVGPFKCSYVSGVAEIIREKETLKLDFPWPMIKWRVPEQLGQLQALRWIQEQEFLLH